MTAKRVIMARIALAGGALLLAEPASAGTLSTIYTFKSIADGGYNTTGVTLVGANLWGVAPAGGTFSLGAIVRVNAASGAKATIYSFTGGADSRNPQGALSYVGGIFYGTTQGEGGSTGEGTVFSFKPSTATLTTLYSFPGANNAGEYVAGALTYAAGTLFGAAPNGGPGSATSPGEGTVFAVTPAGAETTLHGFTLDSGGVFPNGGLLYDNGTVYGTTTGSLIQTYACSVFAIDVSSGATTTLHTFSGTGDGANPLAGVVRVGGYLWGTTYGGGDYGSGTVFKINLKTNVETVVHSFARGSEGAHPFGLTLMSGMLYGATENGGPSDNGTVYSVDPQTGAVVTSYLFTGGSDGGKPVAALTQSGGTLYGTTTVGALGSGTVFKFVP